MVTSAGNPSSNDSLTGKTLEIVGLHKTDLGRTCYVHPDGCGRNLAVGDTVLLQIMLIDEEIEAYEMEQQTASRKRK